MSERPKGSPGFVRWVPWLIFAACAAWFLAFAHPGLRAGFQPDDLGNLYSAWQKPANEFGQLSVTRLGAYHRTAVNLLYKAGFAVLPFDPLPWRVLGFSLLLANLTLAWLLLRRLTHPFAAGVALLLFSYHAYLSDLYYSSATFYDLACFLFSGLALGLQIRRAHPLAVLALHFLALNSKEHAIVLPAVLVLYEYCYEKDRRWTAAMLTGMLSAVSVILRVVNPGAEAANPAYGIQTSLATVQQTISIYIDLPEHPA